MHPKVTHAAAALADEDVVSRVRAGETHLFELLMRRHNERVYRVVRSLVRGEAECEDVMQQAYLAAYTHLAQFQGTAKFSTWLTRIAINEALGRRRRDHRLVLTDRPIDMEEGAMNEPTRTPEELVAGREMARVLERALDALPEMYRTVFVLREVQSLSTGEAAEVLGVSEDVVKTRLHRAKATLETMLRATAQDSVAALFPFEAPRCDRVVAAVMAKILA